MDEGSLSLPPFTGYDEKSQRDYHLALRGNSLNPMIDAATPLLGMVIRLSTMNSQTMPEHLFAQVSGYRTCWKTCRKRNWHRR